MRLSTVEQPVRKEAISAANPKQSLRNIDNYIRSTDSRGKLAACNSQPKPREFVLPLKRMSHLFSNSTDLKAVAVFRAHTRHRQRFSPRPDVARIAPAIRRDVSTRPSPPTHVLRLYVENISFTVTVSISSNNFGAVRFAPHAFSTHIRRLFRAFWRTFAFETAVAACLCLHSPPTLRLESAPPATQLILA